MMLAIVAYLARGAAPASMSTVTTAASIPAKTAMSSGIAKTRTWVLEYAPASARSVDPLMGWTSSRDTQAQVKISFDSKKAALDYAREHGIDAQVQEPNKRKANIRSGGYGENFATGRRGAWTH